MRNFIVAVSLFFALPGAGLAQVETYSPVPRIWDAQFSPDGNRLATGCSPRGVREICLFDLASGDRGAIPAPEGGHIVGFYWPDNTHLIYWLESYQTVAGQGGGHNRFTVQRAVSYNVDTRSQAVLMGRYSNVVGLDRVTSSMIGDTDSVAMELTLSVDGSATTGSRFGDRRSRETVAYSVNLDTGNMEQPIFTSNHSVISFVLDAEGELVAEVRYDDDSGDYAIFAADGRSRTGIFEGTFAIELPVVYGLTDDGAALAVFIPGTGVRRLDLATGTLSAYEIDGQTVSNVDPVVDHLTGEVVGFSYADTLPRQVFLDAELAGLLAELGQILTEDSVMITGWNQTREKLIVEGWDIGVPVNYYMLDLTTGGLGLLDTAYHLAEGSALPTRQSYAYEASDGLMIDGWLTLPEGVDADGAGLPLVVLPHGGPQSRDTGEFDWWSAYYAAQGYAVLQPNFRGSLGRGHDFVEAGYGGFGTRMIDDIIDGAHALQAEGVAQAGGYCAVGGSYGGYAALMMAIRDPENVACVITFAGVTHPFSMLGGAGGTGYARYWEAYMGSRFTDEAYKDSISPEARYREILAPTLVIHGDEDTTVDYDQMQRFEREASGRENFTFLTYQGEDHYLRTTGVRARLLEDTGAFLAEHLPVGN